MKNRAVRIALVVLVLLAEAGAGWQVWSREHGRITAQDAFQAFSESVRGLLAGMAELRVSQQAYVAEGQAPDTWFRKVTEVQDALRAKVADAGAAAVNPAARQALESAAESLTVFAKNDEQVRRLVSSDQRLQASDLIFGDSADAIAAAAAKAGEALSLEHAGLGRRLEEIRTAEAVLAGAAAALSLVALLLLLLPSGAAAPKSETLSIIETAPSVSPPPQPAGGVGPAEPDLDAVSRLCVAFSRIGDPSTLPQLIQQAAAVLNASGLIVWMANPTTRVLQPVLSHGYSELALTRIGELAPEEDNATAEAYRTSELRIVEGSGDTHGALAVPVITPAGCVGVLAAEIRDGGEKKRARQAVAVIVAAQLASLASESPAAK
jgi:GAF domain-containing protein